MDFPDSGKQEKAVEKILAGEDADLADMTMRELRCQPNVYGDLVERLTHAEDAKVRARASLILRTWKNRNLAAGVTNIAVGKLGSWEDLESFCWHLAEAESQTVQLSELMAYLDHLGSQVAKSLPHRSISPTDSISALRQVLARREGFRGDLDDYFNPANSYLHCALTRKLGIPLTLALVYIFAGQRAGLEVYGYNTPGHYLAGIGGVVFDPFHGAVVMSADDLASKFGTDRASWANPMFMRATPHGTAERMLVNLLNSYSRLGDESRHSQMVAYLQQIEENFS